MDLSEKEAGKERWLLNKIILRTEIYSFPIKNAVL